MTMQPNGPVFSFAPTSLGSAHLLMVQADTMKLPSPKKAGRGPFGAGRIALSKVGSLELNGPRRINFLEMFTPIVTWLSTSSPHLGLRRIGPRLRLRLLFLCPRLRLRLSSSDPRLRLHGASFIHDGSFIFRSISRDRSREVERTLSPRSRDNMKILFGCCCSFWLRRTAASRRCCFARSASSASGVA